jgi:hypothetical protein
MRSDIPYVERQLDSGVTVMRKLSNCDTAVTYDIVRKYDIVTTVVRKLSTVTQQ